MKTLDMAQMQVLQAKPRVSGSRIGAIVAMHRGPIVDFSDNPFGPQPAKVVSSLAAEVLASASAGNLPVLLVFEDDDPTRPVIVDVVIDHPLSTPSDRPLPPRHEPHAAPSFDLEGAVPIIDVRIAAIAGVKDDAVLVENDDDIGSPIVARTAITLRNLKDPVVLIRFTDGSAVIVGQVYPKVSIESAGGEGADVVLKGARVTIEADVELILTAGACRVQLDARGKVLTTADQIVSRARGANKIQGGSVQLN